MQADVQSRHFLARQVEDENEQRECQIDRQHVVGDIRKSRRLRRIEIDGDDRNDRERCTRHVDQPGRADAPEPQAVRRYGQLAHVGKNCHGFAMVKSIAFDAINKCNPLLLT